MTRTNKYIVNPKAALRIFPSGICETTKTAMMGLMRFQADQKNASDAINAMTMGLTFFKNIVACLNFCTHHCYLALGYKDLITTVINPKTAPTTSPVKILLRNAKVLSTISSNCTDTIPLRFPSSDGR